MAGLVGLHHEAYFVVGAADIDGVQDVQRGSVVWVVAVSAGEVVGGVDEVGKALHYGDVGCVAVGEDAAGEVVVGVESEQCSVGHGGLVQVEEVQRIAGGFGCAVDLGAQATAGAVAVGDGLVGDHLSAGD